MILRYVALGIKAPLLIHGWKFNISNILNLRNSNLQICSMHTKLNNCKFKLELFFYEEQMSPPLRNKKNHKIAFSYVTRGILWKINMQELWFLCMTRRPNVHYKCLKFRWNTSNGYQVIERTRNISIANDQREMTPKYPKQSYGSCAGHIFTVCSRSVWRFNQIALTVIY